MAVQAQHHVVHLPVGEVDDLVVHQHAIGGEGEAELLVALGLAAAGVSHQLLHHIPVHQRLAAEEVHLQVDPAARMGNEEIQRLLAHLKAHNGALAVVLALAGKAVLAVQVAGVCNVQAQRLDHGAAVLEVKGLVGVHVLGKELACGLQLLHIGQAVLDLLPGDLRQMGILLQQGGDQRLPPGGLVAGDDVVGQVVHRVHRAAVHIQHDVVAVQFVGMDHFRINSKLSKILCMSKKSAASRSAAGRRPFSKRSDDA